MHKRPPTIGVSNPSLQTVDIVCPVPGTAPPAARSRQPNLRGGLQRPFRAFGWSHAGAASPATLGKFRCSLVGPLAALWAM